MTKQELIDHIVESLLKENIIISFNKYQANTAVQITTKEGDKFNIFPIRSNNKIRYFEVK